MAPSASSPNPPTLSRILYAKVFIKSFAALLTRLLTSPFKGKNGGISYFRDVMFATTRANLRTMTLQQERASVIPTDKAYADAAKALKFEPESITLPSGTKAHWVGGKQGKNLLVYFHGGGYVLPATPGLFAYLDGVQKVLNKEGHDVSILCLSYGLAPDTQYPGQLAQAAELLSYVLSTLNKSPSDIIIGGDSAGGNLTMALLSHLMHPHPNPSVPRVEVSTPLRGALWCSPWPSCSSNHPSFAKNKESDIFDGVPLVRWSRAFIGNKLQGDQYSEPLTATKDWWSGLPNVVKDVLVWGGGGEVLIDGIVESAEKMKEGGGNVELVVSPREAHEQMVADSILGYTYEKITQQHGAKTLENWLKAHL